MPSWLKDFEIIDKKIIVKATGAELPIKLGLLSEALAWFPFYFYEKFRKLGLIFSTQKRIKIAFSPVSPRPWYLLSALVDRAHMKRVQDYTVADVMFYFEDKTDVPPPQIPPLTDAKAFNFGCYDISKSRVASVFEQVFGYSLAVDPLTYSGPIAVKSEKNGAHDGYATTAPLTKDQLTDPEMVYQRLIDNSVDGKWAQDMRCPTIGGEIRLVYIKRRPLESRFANFNTSVSLQSPDDLLSAEERHMLKKFAAAMGLDFGGMDVLRDNRDGKIYVVDVNKTDMGPPIAMSMTDKSKSVDILTKQLVNLITDAK